MDDRFRWHPAARLFGPDGREVPRGAGPALVGGDRPGPAALAASLAASAVGLPFRIGATDLPAPEAGAAPVFETLTSGSTGTPRRISRNQASWTASFGVDAGFFGIGPGTGVAVPGRLSQSLALYGAVEALHLGATLHLLDGLRPDRIAAGLAARGAGVLWATPAQLRLILEAKATPAPALRLILSGGAKLDPATRAALARVYPAAQVREFYGSAEASFITISDETTPAGSVGRPYPGVEIALSEAGAVLVRSPYLFQGYASDPGGASWQEGWLATGEIARFEGGHLFLCGRADRMVTVAGHNVFPEEIEAYLLTLPGVTRAAVLSRPDPGRGHVLEAVVEGGEPEAILRACREVLGPLKAPKRLHRPPVWPILPSGKTDLAALQRLAL